MQRILLSMLLTSALVGAADYDYEITPMAGYAYPSSGQELKNHGVYGAEMQYNGLDYVIKPELSVFFSNPDYKNIPGDTNILRSALSGVYNYRKIDNVVPFVKMGLGYETMSDHQYNNHDSLFADAATGIKVDLAKHVAFKFELIDMVKFNGMDNNLLLMAGLNFAFGEKTQPQSPEPISAEVSEPEAAPKATAEPIAAAPLDSDGDGVVDALDKCPGTPSGFKVDQDGCPLTYLFKVLFDFDSSKLKEEFKGTVEEFAVFMKENPYVAEIQGHACNIGTDEYNQALSERRANAVMTKLIELGIDPKRLKAVGFGESKPLNNNATIDERRQNRRVEAELSR
ncbi:OmpA family protein [Sulfuricurvum sp.]|uniref:OmpA family protein n=1 Tax=Sulfuricurvum sp. TaxID=2025608 RepID=UPI003BAF44EA